MYHVKKAAAAVATAAAALALLAGCASGANSSSQTPQDNPTKAQGATTAAQARPEQQLVRVVKLIDPVTLVVQPADSVDHGTGKNFTVKLNDIVTPAKGECGFDDSLAEAKKHIGIGQHTWYLDYGTVTDGVYIDDHGVHHAGLNGNGDVYEQAMLRAGMAALTKNPKTQIYVNEANDAKANGTGLWGTCPGFGA